MSTNICSTPCKSCGNTWFTKDILESDETKTIVSCNNCNTKKTMKKRPMKTVIVVRVWDFQLGFMVRPSKEHDCLQPFNRVTQSRLKEIYDLQKSENLLLEFEKIDLTTENRENDKELGTQVFKSTETVLDKKANKYVEKDVYEII